MSGRPWLAPVFTSLALHGAALALALAFRTPAVEPALFIDLIRAGVAEADTHPRGTETLARRPATRAVARAGRAAPGSHGAAEDRWRSSADTTRLAVPMVNEPPGHERDGPTTGVDRERAPVDSAEPERASGNATAAEIPAGGAPERDGTQTAGAGAASGPPDGRLSGGGPGDAGARGGSPGGGASGHGGGEGDGLRANGPPGFARAPADLAGSDETEYGRYLDVLRRRIQESLAYPEAARRRGLRGVVGLEISVQPNGRIGEATVATSSSHRVLDDAALDAVRSLDRVPFPPGIRPRTLRARLPVVFELR